MQPIKAQFYRICHWEYWNVRWIYFPLAPFWIYYSLKARDLFFYRWANPGMENGGMVMMRKSALSKVIPKTYTPGSILVQKNTSIEVLHKKIIEAGLSFPFVAKPDIGLKGWGVEHLRDATDLKDYSKRARFDYLVQEKACYSHEVGIFYVRNPVQPTGRITGIVQKEYLKVQGNGQQTLKELVLKNPRSLLQYDRLKSRHAQQWNDVVPQGEEVLLVPIGSHSRGALFRDATHRLTPKLRAKIDEVCRGIDGFYYGRLDIMYRDWESLGRGENFQIIEINGANSEPTHMYDPKHSIWFAWKEILGHWKQMTLIALENRKQDNQPRSKKQLLRALLLNVRTERQLKTFSL